MVDIDGKLEDVDIDMIQQSIVNNSLNICKSIDKLTKELRVSNILKIIELEQRNGLLMDRMTGGVDFEEAKSHSEEIIEYLMED